MMRLKYLSGIGNLVVENICNAIPYDFKPSFVDETGQRLAEISDWNPLRYNLGLVVNSGSNLLRIIGNVSVYLFGV